MSQKAYQSIMDANISATQLLQEGILYLKAIKLNRKILTRLHHIEKNRNNIIIREVTAIYSTIIDKSSIICSNQQYWMFLLHVYTLKFTTIRVDKFQAAEKYLKQSIQYIRQSIPDETLLITLINLVILFIKNEKYEEASSYIEQSFSELNSLQDQQLNPKIRLFLGDQSTIMTLQSLEAILLFYSGLTFNHLGQTQNALQAWKKGLDILHNTPKSPYYILTKAKIQNLESQDCMRNKNYNILTSRNHLKSDKIAKFLQAYSTDNLQQSQSFRQLSQKIKRKIGNKMSDQWPREHNEKKIEINNYFSDQKKIQLQINVKDLLQNKNITQRDKQLVKKRPNLDIMEKLNKTHNEIYKSYLAQAQRCNGSKTQRGEIKDLDIRIKINDKSHHSQNLLQTLINKSNEKRSVDRMRDSPDCYSPQQFFNNLKQQLLRSGSQGNIQSPTRSTSKKNTKQSQEKPKTHRPLSDTYNVNLKEIREKSKISVDIKIINRLTEIAYRAQQKINQIQDLLQKQQNVDISILRHESEQSVD